LHIICPVVAEDVEGFGSRLGGTLDALAAAQIEYRIIIVLQTKDLDAGALAAFDTHPEIRIEITRKYSVSRARNLAMGFVEKSAGNYIYFMDASVRPTEAFWEIYKANASTRLSHWVCNMDWSDSASCERKAAKFAYHNRGLGYLFHRMYVWACVFRADLVSGLQFDEAIGPGEGTINKSGEDYLFVQHVLIKNNIRTARFYSDVSVQHLPRPTDFSKHLTYARGQGNLYRLLLFSVQAPLAFYIVYLMHTVLFVGNSILRVVLMRQNSLKIAAERLRGLVGVDSATG
jgi:hypothetical protein